MRNKLLRAICFILICAVGSSSLPAVELTFVGSSNAVVRDFTGSGVFTQFSNGSGGLSIRKFQGPLPSGTPLDERSLIAFDVRSRGDTEILRAYLDFYITGYTSRSDNVGILGYSSNGVLSISDATRSAKHLSQYHAPTLGLGKQSIELDVPVLQSIITPFTQYLGFRLQGLGTPLNTQLAHINSGFNSPPTLRFIVVPEPAGWILFAISATALVNGRFARTRLG